MKTGLIAMLTLMSISTFAADEQCTTGFLDRSGKVTQYGYFNASLKECLKYVTTVTKGMNARGSSSTLVVQHPGIGDSQIKIEVEPKQDLSTLND